MDALRGDKSLGEFSFHRALTHLALVRVRTEECLHETVRLLDCPGKPEKESGTASTITCGEEGEGRVRDERTTDFNPRPSLSRLCESGGRRMPDSGARTFPLCAFFARTTPFCTPQSPANGVTRPGTPAADARAGIATERPTTAGFFHRLRDDRLPRDGRAHVCAQSRHLVPFRRSSTDLSLFRVYWRNVRAVAPFATRGVECSPARRPASRWECVKCRALEREIETGTVSVSQLWSPGRRPLSDKTPVDEKILTHPRKDLPRANHPPAGAS